MRESFYNQSLIIENETFYGISLGYDYCAEHEWGINGIIRKFGIDTNKMGVDGRKINKGFVYYAEDKKSCVLTSYLPYNIKEKKDDKYTPKELIPHFLQKRDTTKNILTAWDEKDFCIISSNKDDFKYIKELYDAFLGNDILITFINSEIPVFSKTSLSLLIVSKVPEKLKEDMYFVDKKHNDLVEYEKEIGITELKEKTRNGYKSEKYFCACSPSWINYEDAEAREISKKRLNTKYDIQFWINYSDDDNNFGWYNAEDIIKWLSTPGLKLTEISKGGSKKNDSK